MRAIEHRVEVNPVAFLDTRNRRLHPIAIDMRALVDKHRHFVFRAVRFYGHATANAIDFHCGAADQRRFTLGQRRGIQQRIRRPCQTSMFSHCRWIDDFRLRRTGYRRRQFNVRRARRCRIRLRRRRGIRFRCIGSVRRVRRWRVSAGRGLRWRRLGVLLRRILRIGCG